MKMQEIHDLARRRNIDPKGMFKTDLIKAIQRSENNFDCYATAYTGECDQINCLWREDCFSAAKMIKNT